MVKRLCIIAFCFFVFSGEASAVLKLDIRRGNIEAIPIAVMSFVNDSVRGREIANVILSDLQSTGLFRGIEEAAFIERDIDVDIRPRFADWELINTLALVTGRAEVRDGERLFVEFRLWDVVARQQMTGLQFETTLENWRRIAHLVADDIYERITGETGYFDTRIAFVAESGPKNNRIKRLAVMDQDGFNQNYLTLGRSLVLTPRFSPSAQEIAYLSYRNAREPRIYLLNIENGQQEIVGDFPGMTFAPRFSPDGQQIVMSLERGGNSNIYTMNLRTRETRRLTSTLAIDTAPSYAPNGKFITFESDRSGRQQLYVMGANGKNIRRISYGDGNYATPVWSPRGDLIAFTKTYKGRFLIGVMRPDGSGERILTEGYHNEGPAWAPNGRVIAFFRENRDPLTGPVLWTVDITGYNERILTTSGWGSDPSWSPLIR